jgi:hypothetical protein
LERGAEVRLHVLVRRGAAPPERFPVAEAVLAGGGAGDAISIPGAPPGAALLVPCAAGVVVEARAAGVRTAGAPLPCGGRRLLRPGERVELPGAVIQAQADPHDGTRAFAGALVRAAADAGGLVPGPHLLVLSGTAAGARIVLRAAQRLGRDPDADVRLDDRHASRFHARLRLVDGVLLVEDLGSKNGVRVDGRRVGRRARRAAPGSEIAVGTTALAFVDPACSRPVDAPPRPSRARHPAALPWAAAAALLGACAAALALAA